MNKIISKALLLTTFFINSTIASESITTMTDYVQHAMTELAASPPITLLKNTKGSSRHELIAGYIKTSVDDNATLSTGSTSKELGSASGQGLGYGYTHSFKEKWALLSLTKSWGK